MLSFRNLRVPPANSALRNGSFRILLWQVHKFPSGMARSKFCFAKPPSVSVWSKHFCLGTVKNAAAESGFVGNGEENAAAEGSFP